MNNSHSKTGSPNNVQVPVLSRGWMLVCAVVLFGLNSSHAQPQNQNVTYLDAAWQPVKNKIEATYYRTITNVPEGYLVKDYYMANNQLQMEAVCSAVEPVPILNGQASFYYASGQLEKSGTYEKGKPVGLHISHYENGQRKNEIVHADESMHIYQYWQEGGRPLLSGGNGTIMEVSRETGEMVYSVVEDSLLTASYVLNGSPADTIYTYLLERADYRGGLESFYRSLANTIVYPRPARRYGIEGRVLIQLEVNELGRMENAKVISSIGGGCDEEAVRASLLQQNWVPGRYKGKPVTMRMVLPITFRLR